MFAIGIRYLNGFVAAADPDDRDRAEWPPHPGRVFMALAAAHFQTDEDPGAAEEREALVWLESLEAEGQPVVPSIVAGEAYRRCAVTHYVPVNDSSGPSKALLQSAQITRDRQPRTFAHAWLESDIAYFVWPDVVAAEGTLSALARLCAKVTRVGHSSSLVQMWVAEAEDAFEPNWIPSEERAVIRLRLALGGTLEYLERQYNGKRIEEFAVLKVAEADDSDKKAQKVARKRIRDEFGKTAPPQSRPALSVYQGYAPPKTAADSVGAAGTVFSPHLIMRQFEQVDGPYRHLDLTSVLAVCQRWRQALLSQSNDLSQELRSMLAGHDADGAPLQGPHLALAPLAFVGHEHADGHLLGVGIALPLDLGPQQRREALAAIGHVRELKLGRLGVWRAEAITASLPPLNVRAETWTAYSSGATHWSTVTPVVFDSHPKSKEKGIYHREVAAMISHSCERIGLPAPREVIVTPVSAHLGAPAAHEFPRLERKDGSRRRHAHAILVFDEPVCGPILLGAGRYRGYGLCRPIREHFSRNPR